MRDTSSHNGQVTRRILRLLECFSTEEPELSLLELSRRLELPKSTVHRLLATLVQEGYVVQQPDNLKYCLSLKVLHLAHVAVSRLQIEEVADPFMRRLETETHGIAHLAVLDRTAGEVVNLKTLSPILPLSHMGLRSHVHSTALGKAIVAYLPEPVLDEILARRGLPVFTVRTITDAAALKANLEWVRWCGCAVDDEESKPGQCCVGAPVQDHTGTVVAAIAVAGPTYLFPPERLPAVAALVSVAANGVSRALGCPDSRLIRYAGEKPPARGAAAGQEEVLPTGLRA